ncbi:MAG: helix-turn-helix domain-containing protein [Pseudomonadota bacterium]
MATLLSTTDVSPKERFAYWREAVCDSYVQLGCDSANTTHFNGEILLNRMSRISTSFVGGTNQVVSRRRKDIAKSSEESFLISLQLQKNGIVSQAGRDAQLQPGDFALYSSVNEYQLRLPDNFRQLVVQIPRQDLLKKLPNADLLTGIRIPGAQVFDGMVGESVVKLLNSIEHANEIVRQCTQDIITDMFVAGLASLKESKYELSQPEQQILLRADAYIEANLRNPNLNRDMLARAMGMSVRRLNELYYNNGQSISSTIRERRIGHIALELRDRRFKRFSITEIAYNWGYSNAQSFVRNFKSQFGVTPTEYRKQNLLEN